MPRAHHLWMKVCVGTAPRMATVSTPPIFGLTGLIRAGSRRDRGRQCVDVVRAAVDPPWRLRPGNCVGRNRAALCVQLGGTVQQQSATIDIRLLGTADARVLDKVAPDVLTAHRPGDA